ncbi:hypothetical protein [Schaalia suimastitidis]|uniref:hypothetical protein n=1 Tax=Schaalia suimastitidis TaxID=121163 RepID=UPI00040E7288|nr:hypothetical protein [Schaalia suimastitidis]
MTGLEQRLNAPQSVPYPGKHLGLRWRSLISADAPAVYDLCRRTEISDHAIGATTPTDIADMVEGAYGREYIDTIVGLDAQRQIAAVASVKVYRDTHMPVSATFKAVVDPLWRGRGIGRSLLYWQDGRARQMLVEIFGAHYEGPASIINLVDSHMTDRRRLCIAAGFSAKRSFQVMYREIEGSEVMPTLPTGYRARNLDAGTLRSASLDDVFKHHYQVPLRGARWSDTVPPCDKRWALTLENAVTGEAVAQCLVGRPAARWVLTGSAEAYIDSLMIAPSHPQWEQWVGYLLGWACAEAAASGIHRLGVDVDPKLAADYHALFERHGFVDDRAQVLYSIDY